MKMPLSLACLALACLAAAGCADVADPSLNEFAAQSPSAEAAASVENGTSPWENQKLIRNASLSLEVKSVVDALRDARKVANNHSAMLSDSRIEGDDDGTRRGVITIRVPSERFDAAIDDFKGIGEVKGQSTEVKDVTKAYLDLETRLQVKRETEQRLRELLRSGTGKVTDVLKVERELERVVTEIERMEGERRYYDQQIALSTIVLNLFEAKARPGPISAAFSSSLQVLSLSFSALIYVVIVLVPWLLAAVLVWVIVALVRRFVRARRRAV